MRHVLEQPVQLGGRKIGVEFEAGAFLDHGGMPRRAQAVAGVGGAPVLPDDGMRQRLAGAAVPQQRGFALVRDADGRYLRGLDGCLAQGLACAGELAVPDVEGVVLDPAGLGEMLGIFALAAGDRQSRMVEQDRARTGGALVEGKDVFAHIILQNKLKQADRPDSVTARPLRFAL